MLIVAASTVVHAPAERVRDAVLDPDAYVLGDTKVSGFSDVERLPDGMIARVHGRLGPFRSSIVARYTVTGEAVDLRMLAGRLRGFRAAFTWTAVDAGVRLTHREAYDFGYGPLSPLLERLLRRWAQRSVEDEVEALRQAAERPG